MRDGAHFVDVLCGNRVDEAALAAALDRGQIVGAALNVSRAPDQMPAPVLALRSDVIATPHMGKLTLPSVEAETLDTVAQMRPLLSGSVPCGTINPQTRIRRP